MALKFRKSFKVAPGLKVNVGKKGVSTSIGGKGMRFNVSSRGTSVGSSIPGTGISYNKKINSRTKRPQRTNYERIQQQKVKEEQLEQAKQKVAKYEAHIDMLTSVHEEINDPIDWQEIQDSLPPFGNDEDGPNTIEAKKALDSYTPTWRDKLFKRIEARKNILTENIEEAKKLDKDLYLDWENNVQQARSVLQGDRNAWANVINDINPFQDISELGSNIKQKFPQTEQNAIVELEINELAVPKKVLKLTKTGKVSQRNMAKGKYFQLYQDYVCSCTLRIARELFTILPINETIIHVYGEASAEDTSENGCILSVKIQKDDLESTYFNNIDCSETIETFTHNMKFLKTKGFKFVEEVS